MSFEQNNARLISQEVNEVMSEVQSRDEEVMGFLVTARQEGLTVPEIAGLTMALVHNETSISSFPDYEKISHLYQIGMEALSKTGQIDSPLYSQYLHYFNHYITLSLQSKSSDTPNPSPHP